MTTYRIKECAGRFHPQRRFIYKKYWCFDMKMLSNFELSEKLGCVTSKHDSLEKQHCLHLLVQNFICWDATSALEALLPNADGDEEDVMKVILIMQKNVWKTSIDREESLYLASHRERSERAVSAWLARQRILLTVEKARRLRI